MDNGIFKLYFLDSYNRNYNVIISLQFMFKIFEKF